MTLFVGYTGRSMDWKSARSVMDAKTVQKAAAWADSHCTNGDFANLFECTGCHPPHIRYVKYDGKTYPAKAFGYLVLMQAGWTRKEDYRPTVNEVINPLRKHGIMDTAGSPA